MRIFKKKFKIISTVRNSDFICTIKGDFLEVKHTMSDHKIKVHISTIMKIQSGCLSRLCSWIYDEKYPITYFDNYTQIGCCIIPNYVIKDILEEFNNKSIF